MRVQKKSKKGLIITIVAVVVVLIAVAIAYLTLVNPREADKNNSSTKETSSNTDKTSSTSSTQKNSDSTSVDQTGHEPEKNIPPQYEGEGSATASGLTGVVNYKSVVDGNLIIRTTINQMVNGGTCNLSLISDSKTVTRTSGIAQNPSSSTCEGFNVPLSDLGSGNWKIEISVTSGSLTGTITDSVSI